MARQFFRYPPRPSSGAGTFSDNIVGLQIVQGGGLTQGNFEFSTSVVEKVNRQFITGVFSEPISLENLQINSILESKEITSKEFTVYPNFDLSEITKFNLYGSLTKRISTSVEKIINFFPAALDVNILNPDYTTGYTAIDCVYSEKDNSTKFSIEVAKIRNPFGIDFSESATRNLSLREVKVSPLRNLTEEYPKYSFFHRDEEYPILDIEPTFNLTSGFLVVYVEGNPFSGKTFSEDSFLIRPNSFYTDKTFVEAFDEVEQFLLNRLVKPIYTANFRVPKQTDDGVIYESYESITWPLVGTWNLNIQSASFNDYLEKLNRICQEFDSARTNLVSRFLTTESFKEFDTEDKRVEKILSIYGRSFDEIKKFIDALQHMTSVNYSIQNDIPSQLLKNLAETLGWKINVSPITNENFLSSVFGNTNQVQYPGFSRDLTPTELNFQFYRNLIMNSAYLFKSKGTRRSIEFILRLVGAPDALIEFNEYIYLAGQRINMKDFNEKFAEINTGIFTEEIPQFTDQTFTIYGNRYTAFTNQDIVQSNNLSRLDYPVDANGFPKAPEDNDDYFFQKGAGWFELTRQHQSPQQINRTLSVFTGQNFNIQTDFEPFNYGQKYLDRFRYFPLTNLGFKLFKTVDNKKSWDSNKTGLRLGNGAAGMDSYYFTNNEKLVLNVKNVDIFMNPSQGLAYDVWYMSRRFNYPIPLSGLTQPYPKPGGLDWTVINPQPSKKSFFEFAQTFWLNMINVRNRQFISDGKTGGYPTLQSIYYKYLESQEAIGIPNDNFTYKTMIDYVNGLGNYWVRLVEQMIPATTIWMAGVKFENSIFHRQKFVYRLQRGCNIVPIPCDPCFLKNILFPFDCIDETFSCNLLPSTNFNTILTQQVNSYATSISKTCISNTLITDWFVELKIDGQTLVKDKIYTGVGLLDVPTNDFWRNSVNSSLTKIIDDGLNYLINGNTLYISNSGCDNKYKNKQVQLNVGLNFSISCN